MIIGGEFHSIIGNMFIDVKGLHQTEQLRINCPRCQEREYLDEPDGKYNLEINTRKGIFHCWKCSEPKFSGTLGKLIRLYGTSSDYTLYKSYSGIFQQYGNDYVNEDELIHVQLPEEFISFSNIDIKNPDHIEAYNYLVFDRKLEYETIIKYRIGFCLKGKYAGRIIVPSYDLYGDINYFVARSYKRGVFPKYLNPKQDKNKIIFNEGFINWDSTLYMVEGAFDGISLHNPLILLGKVLPDKMFYVLKEKKPPIVILLDPDAYGNAIEIYSKLLSIYGGETNKIKIIKMIGDKDIDEIRTSLGKKSVIEILYGARELEVNDYFMKPKYFGNEKNYYRRKNY